MRTHMAPSYINVFIGKFDCEFLQTETVLPLVCWRFIYNVFALWTDGELAFLEFLSELNLHHTSIKFTKTWFTKDIINVFRHRGIPLE